MNEKFYKTIFGHFGETELGVRNDFFCNRTGLIPSKLACTEFSFYINHFRNSPELLLNNKSNLEPLALAHDIQYIFKINVLNYSVSFRIVKNIDTLQVYGNKHLLTWNF